MGRRWLVVALLALAGCGASAVVPAAPSSAGSTASASASASASGSKAPVTVPGLGGTSAGSPVEVTSAAEVSLAVPVDCSGCVVVAGARAVLAGLDAMLVTSEGRALLLSTDGGGALRGSLGVPYGVTFSGLSCGDGRCIVVGAQPDGHAILSAFELAGDGAWRDLSGATGFVSATAKGAAVPLESGLGVSIQVSDGVTTVWTVLGWNGTGFAVLGCAPDGSAPDLSALTQASCLS